MKHKKYFQDTGDFFGGGWTECSVCHRRGLDLLWPWCPGAEVGDTE